jgi:hypothetical protein
VKTVKLNQKRATAKRFYLKHWLFFNQDMGILGGRGEELEEPEPAGVH